MKKAYINMIIATLLAMLFMASSEELSRFELVMVFNVVYIVFSITDILVYISKRES